MTVATRSIYAGDTWPPLKGEASDDNAVLNLAGAYTLTAEILGPSGDIIGPAVAIQPAEADPDGEHNWNWKFVFQPGDTDNPGDYEVYLFVQWDVDGLQLQTFGPDSFKIKPKPE